MRASLVLCVAAALVGGARAACDACLEGHCYNMQQVSQTMLRSRALLDGHSYNKHLISEFSSPHSALYRKTNTLYHYYRNSDGDEFIVKCYLVEATCNDTARISHIINLAVDQLTGDLYGTNFDYPGIYKLDFANAKKVLWVNVSSVWSLTFKDYLYYTTIDGGINVFKNGKSHLLPGTKQYNVKDMIVDMKNDIYFYIDTLQGRFLKRLSKGVILQSDFSDLDRVIMTEDKDGKTIVIFMITHAVCRVVDGEHVQIGAISECLNDEWIGEPRIGRDNNIVWQKPNSKGVPELWQFTKEKDFLCSYSCEEPICKITVTEQ